MATSRTSILRGPGSVIYGGQTFFDADGISADVESATQEVPSSISGPISTIKTDQTGKVTFTPCGQLSAALLQILFPYGGAAIGSSASRDPATPADRPLVIHSLAGTKVTFTHAVISKMPELRLSPIRTAFGSAEFSACVGLGKEPTDAGALYAVAAAAYVAGAPDPADITGVQYAATFGDLAINDTTEGWTVTPEVTLEPVVTDLLGTIDWTVASVGCTATCTPLGLTEEQILAALPAGLGRGKPVGGADDLVITGAGGLAVTLHNASLVRGPLNWGNTALRAGELQFTAHRKFTNGQPGPVFTVEMAA